MSFSVSGTIAANADPSEEVGRIFSENPTAQEAAGEIIPAIQEAAEALAMVLAAENEALTFSCSGHYNGGVEPKEGWASNYASVSLTQIYNPQPKVEVIAETQVD